MSLLPNAVLQRERHGGRKSAVLACRGQRPPAETLTTILARQRRSAMPSSSCLVSSQLQRSSMAECGEMPSQSPKTYMLQRCASCFCTDCNRLLTAWTSGKASKLVCYCGGSVVRSCTWLLYAFIFSGLCYRISRGKIPPRTTDRGSSLQQVPKHIARPVQLCHGHCVHSSSPDCTSPTPETKEPPS